MGSIFSKISHADSINRFQKWPTLSESCQAVASAATVNEAYLFAEKMEENQYPDNSKIKKFINTGTIDLFNLYGENKKHAI